MSTYRDDEVKAKWDRMTSRERDVWVAREVLGLEVYATIEEWCMKGMPHIAEWDCNVQYPAYFKDGYAVTVPHYTTNKESAQEVIEVMKAKSMGVETGDRGGKQFCSIHVNSYYPYIIFDPCAYEECDTFEEAVCLAALVAMEDAK